MMNRCDYHEEGFQFEGLSIGGDPTEWITMGWWKAFHPEQISVHVQYTFDRAKRLSSASVGI